MTKKFTGNACSAFESLHSDEAFVHRKCSVSDITWLFRFIIYDINTTPKMPISVPIETVSMPLKQKP